jgi:iron complex outermembrane recepter protein
MVLKRNLLSVALMSATMMMVGTAQAQDSADAKKTDEAETLDKVTVKGIRSAIEKAIDTKRENTSIVESISAEDIGKLPDASIAESIARLPGLTAQRDRGRAQQINIRGLSGDFATTTLNGREQVSLNSNRGVEFDQFPSELISAVTVYKTPDASLVGQGLSGTIDMQTVSPLSYGEQVIALNYRADQNDIDGTKAYGNRYSFSYIDQFLDNTVGIAIGYAHLDSPGQSNLDESWGYADRGCSTPGNCVFWDGHKDYQYNNENIRNGYTATIEVKPNDRYTSKFDLFWSTYDRDENRRGLEVQPGAPVPNSWTINNGVVTSVSFQDFNTFVIRNDVQSFEDEMFSYGWSNKYKFSDNFSAFIDISGSKVTRDEVILETNAKTSAASGPNPGTATLNSKGYWEFTFNKDLADPNIVLISDQWGQHGYIKNFAITDKIDQVRLGGEYTFDEGMFSSLEFGYNRTDREKEKSAAEAFVRLPAGSPSQIPVLSNLLTGSSFSFAGISGILGYDPLAALNSGVYVLQNNGGDFLLAKNWSIDETIDTFYVQANINTDWGSVPVKGNIGVQVVRADQSSTGGTASYGVVGDVRTAGATYTDVLPSMNLNFELPSEQYLRVAVAKQVARPKMDDMSAQLSFGVNTQEGEWSGGGGNPELKPWLANAFDVSYEKYFGNKGYVSLAYFYKDLKTYIKPDISRFDFADLIASYPLPGGVTIPSDTIGNLYQPINGEGGTLKGWELAVSVPFELMWEPLEGFGMQASYSDTSSNIDAGAATCGGCNVIAGLSKYVSNITLYYERYGFATRVSQRKRSDFVGSVQGFGGVFNPERIEGDEVVDFQVSYSFSSGFMKDFSMYFQIGNLTDEPFKTNNGNPGQPTKYIEYGRTTLLGFSYKF